MILDYNDFTNDELNESIKTFESFIKENYEDEEENEPTIEPEWCEDCMEEAEESGIEYEPNFTWKGSWWECDNCGKPC